MHKNEMPTSGQDAPNEDVFSYLSQMLVASDEDPQPDADKMAQAGGHSEELEQRLFEIDAAAAFQDMEETSPASVGALSRRPLSVARNMRSVAEAYRSAERLPLHPEHPAEKAGLSEWEGGQVYLAPFSGRRIIPPWCPDGAVQVISTESSEARGLFRRDNLEFGVSTLPMCAGVRLLEPDRTFTQETVAVEVGWRETHVTVLAPSDTVPPVRVVWIFGFGWDCVSETVFDRLRARGDVDLAVGPLNADLLAQLIRTGECRLMGRTVALEGVRSAARELFWKGLSSILDRSIRDAIEVEEIALVAPSFLHESLAWSLDIRPQMRSDIFETAAVTQAWENERLVDDLVLRAKLLEIV